jgi:hypothetical protein
MFAGESVEPSFLVLVADPYISCDESTLWQIKWLTVVACRLQSQAELHLLKLRCSTKKGASSQWKMPTGRSGRCGTGKGPLQ